MSLGWVLLIVVGAFVILAALFSGKIDGTGGV